MTTPLHIDSYNRAEKRGSEAPRPAWIYVGDDTHEIGVRVLVDHTDLEFSNLVADAIAELLPDATRVVHLARHAQADAEERARKAFAGQQAAAARLDAVLHGRRRLFGEALVRVSGDGSAWLLDPVKQEAGFGLHYPSLTDLWREHPELRPVRWSGGDLIVDATIALPESVP